MSKYWSIHPQLMHTTNLPGLFGHTQILQYDRVDGPAKSKSQVDRWWTFHKNPTIYSVSELPLVTNWCRIFLHPRPYQSYALTIILVLKDFATIHSISTGSQPALGRRETSWLLKLSKSKNYLSQTLQIAQGCGLKWLNSIFYDFTVDITRVNRVY